ncbi:hypothetical protein PWT90_03369 [Aphanocladium album]|nr:hypothetical protein PWT90_03369 [Aphanocladium album]
MSSSSDDYLDGVRHQLPLTYGATAIDTIILIASFVLCIIALVKLRAFKDLARKFIRWHLAAFVFFTIHMGIGVLFDALVIAWSVVLLDDVYSSLRILGIAMDYISFVSAAAGNLVYILVFLTLVNLGFGIMFMRESGTANATAPGTKRGGIYNARFGAYALGAIIGVLQLALFGLRCKIEDDATRGSYYSDSYLTLGTQRNRLSFASHFLLLLTAACLVCWSSMTLITAKKYAQQSKTPSVYFLVCSLLFFLSRLYVIASFGAHTSLQNAALSKNYENYTLILDPIMSLCPILVILILLFVLGRKQREQGGVWTPGTQAQPQFYGYLSPQQQQQANGFNYGTPFYGVPAQEVKPYPQYAAYPAAAPAPQQLGPNLSSMAQHASPIQQQTQHQETWNPAPNSYQHQHMDVRVASPSLTPLSATSPAPQEVPANRPTNTV